MKIHEFLKDESQWCQGHLALDKKGNPQTSAGDEAACSWCLMGLISKCYIHDYMTRKFFGVAKFNEAMDKAREKIGVGLIRWNDAPERTFADVKKLVTELDI